ALGEISPGRFRLGLGVGGLQDLASMGVQVQKPVEAMRKTVQTLRSIWGGEFSITDKELRLESYKPQYGHPVDTPVFMGVRGPKLLSLAAETADGVILSGPREYVRESIGLVRERRCGSG
ncbi:MAG: LLM class flavin-dependent oxidoreductase, partial [Candidatus Bathyarchaeia archaeon]